MSERPKWRGWNTHINRNTSVVFHSSIDGRWALNPQYDPVNTFHLLGWLLVPLIYIETQEDHWDTFFPGNSGLSDAKTYVEEIDPR